MIIQRVLISGYVEDFDALAEELKHQWVERLVQMAQATNSVCDEVLQSLRGQGLMLPDQPKGIFSQHVEKVKPKWFAEIELFCENQHDSQAPRLFLKAGEVFAGNRAARRIFSAAKQSLDIIDTFFGPEVFDMLEVADPSVAIRLISDKAKPPTKQAYNFFKHQYGGIEFRTCDPKEIHDRFVIVDSKTALHLGGSIKDLGKSDSLIDATDLDPHKKRFEELWLKGQLVIF